LSSLSTFVAPNYTPDIFEILYDLPPSQKINAARFQTLKLQASLSSEEQIELNNLTIALQSYIIDPDKWNKFAQALSSMEGLLLDFINLSDQGDWSNITSYSKFHIVEYLGQTFMSKQNTNLNHIPLGGSGDTFWTLMAVKGNSFNWRDAWDSGTIYNINDGVFYNNSSYVCILTTTAGIVPTNATYFSPLALKGATGATGLTGQNGLGLTYIGNYDAGTTYYIGNAVNYNNNVYYCINTSTGNLPTVTGYWSLFLANSGIIVQSTAPTSPYINLLWVDSSTSQNITQYWNGLAWVICGNMAVNIAIADAGNIITATDVEGALQEIAGNVTTNTTNITNNSDQISVLSLDYNVVSSDIDANDIFTQVQYLNGSTLYMQSNLSGGTSPSYTTDTWTYYESDGVTVTSTLVWTLGYDSNGNLISRTHL